jgi:hypothetical protein
LRIGGTDTASAPRSRERRRPRSLLRIAVVLFLVIGYTALVFAGGVTFFAYLRPALQNLSGATTTRHAMAALVRAPGNYLRAQMARAPVEQLSVDVKFKHMHKIHEKRAEAMRMGVLLTSSEDLVPATITHRGRTVPVKIRLKGDLTDHLVGDKWSFRVQVKSNDQLFGMRRFSIQAPSTRGFHSELFALEHLRREGVLAPRYFFVDVVVNGKNVGLMALEEHFSKELLESQQRKEGVILRFDEEPFWQNMTQNVGHGPFDNFRIASIQPFASGRISRSRKLSADLEIATGLLRAFIEHRLPATQVFDVELLGRFLAVAEIWRSTHALRWHNVRFYFNPITARLEPVGFDLNLQIHYAGGGLGARSNDYSAWLLEDSAIRRAFIASLRRIADDVVAGPLLEELRELEAAQLVLLHREFPLRAPFDFQPVLEHARLLRTIDEGNFPLFAPEMGDAARRYARALEAYIQEDARGRYLELVNTLPVPVKVTSLRFSDIDAGPDFAVAAGVDLPLELPPTDYQAAPSPLRLYYAGGDGYGVDGVAWVEGQAESYSFAAVSYAPPLARNPVPRASLEEALAQHAFLGHDAQENWLRVAPGRWDVQGSLVLPEGMGLRIPAGTRLFFPPREGLVASGPLEFAGTPEEPVVLEGARGDDPARLWAGVVVLESDRPCHWSHVFVRHTGGFDHEGWSLTGGVVFRKTSVTLEGVHIEGSRGEDALNVIRSRIAFTDVDITDTASDAFDGDFTEGTLEGGRISRVGGDGIDVSGSEVVLRGVYLSEIRDKAVSVGEASRLGATGLRIEKVGTAFVSKDSSRGEISDSLVEDVTHVALMAYVKKPEYGPGEVVARNNRFSGVGKLAVAQVGRRVVVDGEPVAEEDVDVDALYDKGYMRR